MSRPARISSTSPKLTLSNIAPMSALLHYRDDRFARRAGRDGGLGEPKEDHQRDAGIDPAEAAVEAEKPPSAAGATKAMGMSRTMAPRWTVWQRAPTPGRERYSH